MRPKPNCWEYFGCGRQPGGENVFELGVCPAAITTDADGLNSGQAAGRICWAIAGTFCDGIVQGTEALERRACHECGFLDLVQEQEGRFDFKMTPVSSPGSAGSKNEES